jgi:hypothetical protein
MDKELLASAQVRSENKGAAGTSDESYGRKLQTVRSENAWLANRQGSLRQVLLDAGWLLPSNSSFNPRGIRR